MLKSVIITYFFLGGISDVGPVQILVNHFLHYIYSWMKEIRMVLMYYVTLGFWRNNNIILTNYNCMIDTSVKLDV